MMKLWTAAYRIIHFPPPFHINDVARYRICNYCTVKSWVVPTQKEALTHKDILSCPLVTKPLLTSKHHELKNAVQVWEAGMVVSCLAPRLQYSSCIVEPSARKGLSRRVMVVVRGDGQKNYNRLLLFPGHRRNGPSSARNRISWLTYLQKGCYVMAPISISRVPGASTWVMMRQVPCAVTESCLWKQGLWVELSNILYNRMIGIRDWIRLIKVRQIRCAQQKRAVGSGGC